MSYLALKHLHIACVVLSGGGFFLRGLLRLAASPWLEKRWVRVLPHCVDTVLLASAVALAVMTHQYPFVDAWLTAKVLALVLYIVCGAAALRRGGSRARSAFFFVVALAVFAYIVRTALTRSPL